MMINPMARHRARCRETRAHMSDYIDGDLPPGAARRLERHTSWCPNCGRMLTNLRRTVGGLRTLHDLDPPGGEAQLP